ncbi:MAG: thiamine phosphate synthase [Rhodothermales bacterium]
MAPAVIGRFHVLTDFHLQQRFTHSELARLAIAGGADTIQFRHKFGGIRHVLFQALKTAEACRELQTTLLIDDRLDVMLACGAGGVHLGQTDFPIRDARRVLGARAIIGGSATTLHEAMRCRDEGADYVGFGPVFATESKENPGSVKGLEGLAEVCEALDVPVVAIGGISVERVVAVVRAGAHGVAVMSAVTSADDPEAAARAIRNAIDVAIGA